MNAKAALLSSLMTVANMVHPSARLHEEVRIYIYTQIRSLLDLREI